MLIGFGTHTKLFRFLNKTPKTYRATLWLGAKSDSLDIEMIDEVEFINELKEEKILEVLKSLEGELEYEPPIFSAKRINGQRAYDLARAGVEVKLNKINSTIYNTKLISYCHPYVTFEATVSEGTYIRSLGRLIANRLGVVNGSLSMLERLNEGQFKYDGEKALDIKKSLNTPMQMAQFTALMATGKLPVPHFAKDIGKNKYSTQLKEVLTEDELKRLPLIQKAMYQVCHYPSGTATNYLKLDPKIKIAGKTGTAQVVGILQGIEERQLEHEMAYYSRSHAWFTTYGPYKDPQYVVLVMVEHGGHGGQAAGGITSKIYNKLYELGYLNP